MSFFSGDFMFVDLHCDTLLKLAPNKGDLLNCTQKFIESGGLAQCFAVFTPPEFAKNDHYGFFLKKAGLFYKLTSVNPRFKKAANAKEIINNANNGCFSAVLTVEDAGFLAEDICRLNTLKNMGIKILSLCWNNKNALANPASEVPHLNRLGLCLKGKEVVSHLESLNILLDVSHLSDGGFFEAAAIYKGPIIATHSCCKALCRHHRNLEDEQIKVIAESGGVVGVNYYSRFLGSKTETAKAEDIIHHIKHLVNTGGEDVAALGSDYDGIETPVFFGDITKTELLTNEIRKQFRQSVADKICYKNALRVLN